MTCTFYDHISVHLSQSKPHNNDHCDGYLAYKLYLVHSSCRLVIFHVSLIRRDMMSVLIVMVMGKSDPHDDDHANDSSILFSSHHLLEAYFIVNDGDHGRWRRS